MKRRQRRWIAVTGAATMLALLAPAGLPQAGAASPDPVAATAANAATAAAAANSAGAATPAATAAAATPPGVIASVASVSPISPPATATDTIVTVVVSITNNTADTLTNLRIQAVRDVPIVHQTVLDEMLAHPAPPTDADLTQPMPSTNFAATIAPQRTLQISYQFPASTIRQTGGVCLCQEGIYPLDLSIYAASSAQASHRIGWVQTYLISITSKPAPVQVSWLWPLIDVPHRLTDDQVFTDDDLAASVEPGGRLDRALQVLEQIAVPDKLTVAIDPELIDELEVMSTGYHVQEGTTLVLGTGGQVAAAWLSRLRAVLDKLDPNNVTLTPYDDPDVDAVTQAGLTWATSMPPAMRQRVQTALGRSFGSSLAWPPGETVTNAALARLIDGGASSIVLNDTTLPGGRNSNPPLNAVADVSAGSAGSIAAVVTSAALEARVNQLLPLIGSQLAELPAMLSELAIRTVEDGSSPSYVVLTPDRYINTNPTTAVAVINATAASGWSSPLSVSEALASVAPVDHGTLATPSASAPNSISTAMLTQARATTTFVQTFSSALQPGDAAALLDGYPVAIQGCESAAWTQNPAGAQRYAKLIAGQSAQLASGIRIVRPSNGAYSVASSSAPLLVTVLNNLPVSVKVRVRISSADGVPGFHTDDAGVQTILANSRATIKVQAHVARSGHFRVQAVLLTPAGGVIGSALPLSIYSSLFGTVGVVITIIACAVLLLALINRFTRRWLHHRKTTRTVQHAERVPAGVGG